MNKNSKKSRHGFKIIRRFNEDIWAVLALTNKPSQVLNYVYEAYQNNYKYRKLLKRSKKFFFFLKKKRKFLYKIVTDEKEFKRKKRTLRINNYLNMLKLRRFYGNIKKKKFKRSFKNFLLTTNITHKSFAYFLESRLDIILFRTNLFKSIFNAKQYINHKKVYVNGCLVNKPGFRLKIGDVVNVIDVTLLYNSLKLRLKDNTILGNYPSYMYINYKLGLIKLIKLPENSQVPFPFFMNISQMSHKFSK